MRIRGLSGLVALLAGGVLAGMLVSGASGAGPSRCEEFATAATLRAAADSGRGERVTVIGDSWSVGLGLSNQARSWPSWLEGRVHVAGFSGSGFSATASACERVSFADRARAAVRGGAELVVVQGGLNDFDQPAGRVRAGFARLARELRGYDVVVVGPAVAPARADRVPRLDAMLARLCREADVRYVSTVDLDLSYLPDGLHLTAAGHRAFGDAVARRISALG